MCLKQSEKCGMSVIVKIYNRNNINLLVKLLRIFLHYDLLQSYMWL